MSAIAHVNKQKNDANRGVTSAQAVSTESESALFDEFSSILDKIASKIGRGDQSSALSQVLTDSQIPVAPVQQVVRLEKPAAVTVIEAPASEKMVLTRSDEEQEKSAGTSQNEDKDESSEEKIVSQDSNKEAPVESGEASTATVSEAAASAASVVHKECTAKDENAPATLDSSEEELNLSEQLDQGEMEDAASSNQGGAVAKVGQQVSDKAEVTEGTEGEVAGEKKVSEVAAKTEVVSDEGKVAVSSEGAGQMSETEALIKAITKQLEAKAKEATAAFNAASTEHGVGALISSVVHDSPAANQVSVKASLEQMVMKVGEAKGGAGLGLQSFQGGEGTLARGSIAQRAEEMRSRPLPRAASTATMDKVENALKEVAKSRDGKTISVRLDPPELGAVKIDVTMRDSGLHARLVAENSQVSQLLKEKAADLQMTLRKLGLNVDSVTVSVHSDESGRNFAGFSKDQGNSSDKKGTKSFGGTEGSVLNSVLSATVDSGVTIHDHWVA